MADTSTAPEPSREERFITHLNSLRTDSQRGTAAMAALRRGLGRPPGSAAEMHRYLVPALGNAEGWWADARYLVASLYAYWHQGHSDHVPSTSANFGASFARLKDESDSIEKRFEALLNSHVDDLPQHLRHAVGLLKGKDVSVSWAQLLYDVSHWDSETRFVQRNWAKGFWGLRQSVAQSTEDVSESTTAE